MGQPLEETRQNRGLVLVPGAGGSPWYWHRLVPELEQRGHDVVAVDLPAANETAGLAEYADAIVESAEPFDNVVVVAQSMGGLSAPLVVGRLDVDHLILINAMIPRPGETGGEWWSRTGQPQAQAETASRDGRPADEELSVLFFHDVPEDVTAEAMEAGDPPQSEKPFLDPWPLEEWPDVATTVVSSRDDRLFPIEFQRRVARERLGLDPIEIPGGHLVALSQPVALADTLATIIDPPPE